MRLFFTLVMIISSISYSMVSNASSSEVPLQFQFIASDTVNQDIDKKLLLAEQNNKKLLLVLGAKWCHDSRGLASKFNSDEMQPILNNNYEMLFIDVGYLEKGFDVAARFGMPVYYGTPTVMVIDPVSKQLVNADSMAQWLSADSIQLNYYQTYFSEMAEKQSNIQLVNSPRLQEYYQAIEAVELTQAARIQKAYSLFSPILRNYKENQVPFTKEWASRWQEVQKLRYKLQKDILELKAQAQQAVLNKKPLELTFPSYPTFDWE